MNTFKHKSHHFKINFNQNQFLSKTILSMLIQKTNSFQKQFCQCSFKHAYNVIISTDTERIGIKNHDKNTKECMWIKLRLYLYM